ncbi:hypothetical protein M569_05284 [Genlisea aurea]|uniref:NAB domain-containing protein n=1 Tax=Genlisea aurea TaxID=192259 RepID=S8CWY2_9LAMI|nr:hypothetical protein M569_05284 [Genlisea aurea]
MLQRAATSAYSWWWASHVRTKQSKWLEQSLIDMEDKVQYMVKLIDEDGDSFAERAEMYYRRRPELITCVEDSYRTFRALADRYDILSKDLQSANNTIATVCPEHVRFSVPEDDSDSGGLREPPPDEPSKASKKISRIVSGLSQEEAAGEVSRLHKDILALQTVKEFVKSSYESGLEKYWGIEDRIAGMQRRVSILQDEFSAAGAAIEDGEAGSLMAEIAIRSCQETLSKLQEKQEKATKEAREEYRRIEVACERLQSLRNKYLAQQSGGVNHEETEDSMDDETEESFDSTATANSSAAWMADKIDRVVDEVIGLETAVSSQAALVGTLRTETDDLNAQIQTLEDRREDLVGEAHHLRIRVGEIEEKISEIQDLHEDVEIQSNTFQTNLVVARESKLELGGDSFFRGNNNGGHHPQDFAYGDDDDTMKEKSQELNWQQLLLSGIELEDRDKIILREYTTILRNYKDLKNKLSEMEKKDREREFDVALLKQQTIRSKDDEIRSLRGRVSAVPTSSDADGEEEIKSGSTVVERRLRMSIDAVLEENLDFWLRFSSAFHQIQKFDAEASDVRGEVSKLRERAKSGVDVAPSSLKSEEEARPVYKHLCEVRADLSVWLDRSALLRDELKRRFASLCEIQDEITRALRGGGERDGARFSSHKAARFQGEVLNMEQENNMVRDELQAGADHVRGLQLEVERTVKELSEEFEISSDERPENTAKSSIPLRSFLFGTKVKRPRNSIFYSMRRSKRYQILKATLRRRR